MWRSFQFALGDEGSDGDGGSDGVAMGLVMGWRWGLLARTTLIIIVAQ